MTITPKAKAISIEIISALLVLVFLYTGITKLLDHRSFLIQMANNPVFYKYPKLVSLGAPILEIVIAVLLIMKRTRIYGLWMSFFLMLFFSWYVYYLMVNIPKLPCSCGGIISALNWPQHLTLNIVLTILSLVAIYFQRTYGKVNAKHKLAN